MTIRLNPRRSLRPVASREGVPTVYVDGVLSVEAKSAARFREQLAAVGSPPVIRVEFNCDGGEISEGMSMYNALRSHPARKVGVVMGIAASMASVILMACDERRVAKGAVVMVHLAQGGARGTASQIEAAAASIRKMQSELLDIYEARTRMSRAELEATMAVDTYLTAEEAVRLGFADAVETFEARVPFDAVARLRRDDPKALEAFASRGMVLQGDARQRAAAYLARVKG